MTAALVAAFLLLLAVALWSVIGGRGAWWLKLPLILAIPALVFAVHRDLSARAGWPTTARPPKTAQFLAGFAREPNPQTHDAGAIFLYLLPPHSTQPRSFRLPYSRQTHEELERAGQEAKGGPVALRFRRGGSGKIPRSAFRAYRLPTPRPPQKTAPAS